MAVRGDLRYQHHSKVLIDWNLVFHGLVGCWIADRDD